jgi:hypothetical protein
MSQNNAFRTNEDDLVAWFRGDTLPAERTPGPTVTLSRRLPPKAPKKTPPLGGKVIEVRFGPNHRR